MRTFLLMMGSLANTVMAAQLIVPEAYDVLSVNGVEQGMSLMRKKEIALQPGQNVIVLEYDEIFDSEINDSHDSIRSQPYALVFTISANQDLRLHSPGIKSREQAESYAKAPTFRVETLSGPRVEYQAFPAKDLSLAINQPPTTVAPPVTTPPPGKTPRMPYVTEPSSNNTATPPAQPDALQMLQFWWSQATPEQRQQFLQQIQANNPAIRQQ